MRKELLTLTPKRYLCPSCGEWHDWKFQHNLGYYNSSRRLARFSDPLLYPGECTSDEYVIAVEDEHLTYVTKELCGHSKIQLCDRIPIESIIEHADQPIVTFSVPLISEEKVGRTAVDCIDCNFKDKCNLIKLSKNGDGIHMNITLGFEFEHSEYMQFTKMRVNEHEQKPAEQPAQQKIKEDTTMANNIFNMNMEFGPNKDRNIASTLMGVAVKNNDSWRIYDKKKNEITDVGDMQLGNLPIFILPTTRLSVGDLIKDSGEYYFVTKVATLNKPTQTLSARTGEMKNVIPIKNILGFSCYSKVIALSDSLNMGDNFDVEKLAIMSAMCGQNGENGSQMNQLLPLMLFKDKLGGDDDSMNLMLMSSMMTFGADGGQMNQLLPLMLFKDKLGGDDDSMKLMLMSSMMTSGADGGQMNQMNQLLPLMLFKDELGAVMVKKEDKTPQIGDSTDK